MNESDKKLITKQWLSLYDIKYDLDVIRYPSGIVYFIFISGEIRFEITSDLLYYGPFPGKE